ncbi:MAG: dTMP kinase [SAR202 cluster bacterium]|nr:dTMP kinase [SAR202 cluster bacterium]
MSTGQTTMNFGATGNRLKKRTVTGGLLITFEGGEGVGKSTQAERLFRKLDSYGIDVVLAHEPGSSDLGNHVRRWIKRANSPSPLAETLLFEAARAQLMFELVQPALSKGKIVILDRFIDSTIAYQGYGRGGEIKTIQHLNTIATAGLIPELTILLDIDPELSLARVSNKPDLFDPSNKNPEVRIDNESERRFEQAPLKFHKKVREGYLKMSKGDRRWCVIGADQAGHRIADAILKRVRRSLTNHGVPEELLKS